MDRQELSRLVLGDDPAKVPKWHDLFRDPVFVPRYNMNWVETRDEAYKKLKKVQESGLISVKDFFGNPKNIFLAHEFLGCIDSSAVTKLTVQYNLFGGSITALHTERHKYLFDKIDDFSIIGCFCLTELGFGNNAVKMETTATYDAATQEFVVHCPTTLSQKYWITNGYRHSNYALVMAQTIVKGKNEGVGAFLVRIRDDNMNTIKGVTINDMGVKQGSNGVDNAIIRFEHVRIPRVNMFNKYTDVDEQGNFHSEIKSLNQRFFFMTERLLSGRLCIASMSIGATRVCLHIALKYAKQRLAVGESGQSDTPIFSYQLQQNAIMPLMARTFALGFLHTTVKDIFQNPTGNEDWLLSLCCVDKTLIGWNTERVGTICRERCGGQGFLAANRFADIISSSHAAMTAEGDNRVLMVKVCKDYITNVTKKGHAFPKMQMCPVRQISKLEDITSLAVLTDLLVFREVKSYELLTKKSFALVKSGKSPFEVLMQHTSDEMQELAWAFGERHTMQACNRTLAQLRNHQNKAVMEKVFRLFGCDTVLRDLSFYLVNGVVNQKAALNLKATWSQLVKEVAVHSDDLLACLNIPVDSLHTPIAADYVKYNEYDNQGEVVGARM